MHKVALLFLLVAGCKKSETTAPATGSGTATPPAGSAGSAVTGSGAATPGDTAAGSAGSAAVPAAPDATKRKIECAKVIPQKVADTYFQGIEQEHGEPTGAYSDGVSNTTCRFIIDRKTNAKILVEYQCGGDVANLEDYLATQQRLFPKRKIKRVPDIGRGAYQLGGSSYGAQHRSLPCQIMIDLSFLDEKDPLRKKDYFAVLRDLEAALPDAP
jgi:hypothetical protein